MTGTMDEESVVPPRSAAPSTIHPTTCPTNRSVTASFFERSRCASHSETKSAGIPRSVVRPTVPTRRFDPSRRLRNGTKIDDDVHAAPKPQSSSHVRTAARFLAKRGGAVPAI
jgi:hypothetical protein